MSIEAMKRIKSLLQDTKMIDSHTISAVVAECDMAILAQHPATTEPVAWNSIQIASWIGSQLMHEPSMFERATVCKFVRSLGRHPTLLKHSPKPHPAPSVPADVMLDRYDAGILNDFGGGNVEWWQDYIRAELGHAHDFYQSQIDAAKDAT